jgi:hypothetical protein
MLFRETCHEMYLGGLSKRREEVARLKKRIALWKMSGSFR